VNFKAMNPQSKNPNPAMKTSDLMGTGIKGVNALVPRKVDRVPEQA
jgi:hypothetical protein